MIILDELKSEQTARVKYQVMGRTLGHYETTITATYRLPVSLESEQVTELLSKLVSLAD